MARRIWPGAFIGAALVFGACGSGAPDAAPETTTPTTSSGSSTTSDGGGAIVGTQPTIAPAPELSGTFTKLSEPGVGGRITSIAFPFESPDGLLVGGDMLGIARTDSFGEEWLPTSGMSSWEVGDISTDRSSDGRIWAGSLSGPHASTDDGQTWALSRDGMPTIDDSSYSMPIETILIDPNNGDRLLAFNGNQRDWRAAGAYSPDGIWSGDGSVWQSLDSGRSWSEFGRVAPGANVRAAVFLGDGQTLVAATNIGVFSSSDAGATWFAAGTGLPHTNAFDVAGDTTNPGRAWVSLGVGPQVDGDFIAGGIWRTTDAGQTWEPANSGLNIVANATETDTGSFHQVVSARTNPDRLYTSNVAPGQAAVYRSDDGGSTWDIIADGATERPNAYEGALRAFDIAVHPQDADVVAIGSDEALLGSTNGGAVWTDLTTIYGRPPEFFSGRGYSGLVSTDVVMDKRVPEETILLGFDGGNFIQSIDGGTSWRRSVQPISRWGGGVEAAYGEVSADTIYVVLGQFSNFRGLGVSTDGGASFSLHAGSGFGLPEVGNIDGPAEGNVDAGTKALHVMMTADGSNDAVFVVVGGQLFRSVDGAANFSPVGPLSTVTDVVSVDGTLYASSANGVFRSSDLGTTWEPMAGSPTGITSLRASPDGNIYGVGFRTNTPGLHAWRGGVWQQLLDDPFTHDVAVDHADPNLVVVVTSEPAFHDVSNALGVYMSSDAGATFTIVNNGLPMTRARTAEFDPSVSGRLVVGTTGRGFYEVSVPEALAG